MTEWTKERLSLYAHPQPIFFYCLILGYYYQHNYEAVLENMTRIQKSFPAVTIPIECQYRMADSLFALERYSEAAKEYDKITKLYTPSSRIRVMQARYRIDICNTVK